MGVIGLAIYEEEPKYSADIAAISHAVVKNPSHQGGLLRAVNTASVPMSMSADVGAGFGERTDFRTGVTSFERGEIVGTWVIYYRTRSWFQTNGITIPDESVLAGNAFPADLPGCKPPVGWPG